MLEQFVARLERMCPLSFLERYMEKNNTFNAAKPSTEHQNIVLEALREVNRELIICAGADIPEAVSDALNAGRDHIIRAVRLLTPIDPGRRVPIAEQSVAEFKRAAEEPSSRFRDLFSPLS
jgi:hypothetical protein